MLPSGNVIKKTALTAMKDKWLNLCAASCIVIFSIIITTLTDSIFSFLLNRYFRLALSFIVFIFVCIPLIFGTFRFFKRAVWGENDTPAEVFYCFSSKKAYLRAAGTGLYICLRFCLSLLIFMIPSALAGAFSNSDFYSKLGISMPSFAPALSVVSFLLSFAAVLAAVVVNLSLYPLPFLTVANEDISLGEAVRLSNVISRGTKADFCWLTVSLGGWILLSVLVFPLFFTLPYFFCCYTVHCRFCVAKYNKTAEQQSRFSSPSFNPKF